METIDLGRAVRAPRRLCRARFGIARPYLLALLAFCHFLPFSAGCSRWSRRRAPAYTETPTADEIVRSINQNAERAYSLIAHDLDIASNQVPVTLDGRLALEKPRRFRMQVFAPVSHNTVADLGSNDREFWVYVSPPNQQACLYHCSYADYGRVQHQSPIPFQPDWVFESLGFLPLPTDQSYAVQPGRRGTIELIGATMTAQGERASLVTVYQPGTGYVVERRLEAPGQSRVIARATLSRHQRDPAFGFVYPSSIAIVWPDQDLDLKIQMAGVQVNPRFDADQRQELWRMPRDEYVIRAGADELDLGARTRQVRPAPPPGTQLELPARTRSGS